jgi:hypothetical protein
MDCWAHFLFGGYYVLVLLVQCSLEHICSELGLHTWAGGSTLVIHTHTKQMKELKYKDASYMQLKGWATLA